MRAHAQRSNLTIAFVTDPALNKLRAEHVTFQKKIVIVFQSAQRIIQQRALDIGGEVAQTRWLLKEETTSIPAPFLIIVASWLAIIFTSSGLFAPRNTVVLTVLLASSLSIAGAVFLILDMAQPFKGFVRLSSVPLRQALTMLGQ